MTAGEYLAMRKPRVPDVPSSAPIYDELTRRWRIDRSARRRDEFLVQKNRKRMVTGRIVMAGCTDAAATASKARAWISRSRLAWRTSSTVRSIRQPDRVPAAVGVAGPGEARAGTAAPMAANSSTVAPVSTGTRVTVVNSGKPGLHVVTSGFA
ncbi:hypothetical protein P7I89_05870 [Pseudomonas aeruginosa]|nr:hypothetical protein P7I89_05870 [Pseudomonas aeruginosa]